MRSSTGLVASKTSKIDVRRYFAVGDRVSAILHIHDTLCIAAKEGSFLFGMILSAFVRTCTIEELAKKGV